MPDKILLNQGSVSGTYDGYVIDINSNILSTRLLSGLTATKSANKTVWAGGYLIYTISVTNNADNDFESPTLTDTLDITQVKLVADSVEVNGSATAYTYNDSTGLLTVLVPTIITGTTTTVTFQVEKV